MFAIAFMLINSSDDSGKIESKAEVMISVSWPDSHPDDVDAMSYAAVVLFADKNMEYDQGVMLICIVIFSMFCTAKWLDAEKIIKLEYLKAMIIFLCVCYLYFFSPEILLINVLFFYLLLNIAFLPFLDRE